MKLISKLLVILEEIVVFLDAERQFGLVVVGGLSLNVADHRREQMCALRIDA